MLILFLADTSRNGMPSSSASCWPCSVDTALFSSQSHLFPMSILWTPSLACCSTLLNQVRISVNSLISKHFKWKRAKDVRFLTVKWTLICDIINKEYAHCSPVISRRNRPKPFLPSRIPNLEFDTLAVQLNRANLEVDANCGDERRCKGILAEP